MCNSLSAIYMRTHTAIVVKSLSTGVADLSHVHNVDAVSAHHVQGLVCNLYEKTYSDSGEVTEKQQG